MNSNTSEYMASLGSGCGGFVDNEAPRNGTP
jgi:hypothetical protein